MHEVTAVLTLLLSLVSAIGVLWIMLRLERGGRAAWRRPGRRAIALIAGDSRATENDRISMSVGMIVLGSAADS